MQESGQSVTPLRALCRAHELGSTVGSNGYVRSEAPATFANAQYDRGCGALAPTTTDGWIQFVAWEVNEQHIKFSARVLNSILLSVCRQSSIPDVTFVKALITCTNG